MTARARAYIMTCARAVMMCAHSVPTGSRLYVVLAGDVWSDTTIWDVLEFGAIPVVERRPSYKGCVDPTGWLRDTDAPVMWVDRFDELPAALERALADDDSLEARRRALVRWWAATKRDMVGAMVDFHDTWSHAPSSSYPRSDCTSAELSETQERVCGSSLHDLQALLQAEIEKRRGDDYDDDDH